MAFIAQRADFELWDYIIGHNHLAPDSFNGIYHGGNYGMSIATNRYYYLEELNCRFDDLKLSLRDPVSDRWTKWIPFPGLLWDVNKGSWGNLANSGINAAIDVHRSVLPNEIVIESDYPDYEDNWKASRIIGAILEKKGFQPHYYYSGSKSIHIHVFLDWEFLRELDPLVKDQLSKNFNGSLKMFQKKFIEWLRTKMIACWDTKAVEFDENLIRASHLIRAELSRNKKGFKTFLGYCFRDMSPIPYICNEENRIYPQLAEIKLSRPNNPDELIEEYLEEVGKKTKIEKIKKRNRSLNDFMATPQKDKVRECVKLFMEDSFKEVGDGLSRAMFILVNELRAVFGDPQARVLMRDWNVRMGSPIVEAEIDYRFKKKNYFLSCKYIHSFLKELNIVPPTKC
ncbi:MAG: hypothetical protein ACTSU7_00355 [Candidatus Heimdallarchaeaceae archaeon]